MVKIIRCAPLLLLLLLGLIPLACAAEPIGIDNTCTPPVVCEELADCYSEGNYELGTECRNSQCLCPDWEGMSPLPCCLKGADPYDCKRQCSPIEDCEPEPCRGSTSASSTGATSASSGGGAGGQGGGGGAGGTLAGECVTASDCGAIDPICGTISCDDQKCTRSIKIGPIAPQSRGDCKRTDCDTTGHLITVDDPSDWYNDGKECTLDYCKFDASVKLSESVNEPVWNGFGCPETGAGACFDGGCVECIDGTADICGNGFACEGVLCVLNACWQSKNDVVDSPPETGVDCGGQCYPCFNPQTCKAGTDCADGVCSGGTCALPNPYQWREK